LNTIRRGLDQVRPFGRVRPEDATIVTRLAGAGAILLGKHPACPRRRLTAATLVI
jgi:hypothetical protein